MKFLVLFLLVPLTELYVLIEVGSVIGGLTTVLLVVGTAILGASLMRSQGLLTMQKAQAALASGEAPQQAMLEGVMIFIGGLFLLVPGFITDILGLLFLIPPIRHRLASQFLKHRTSSRYYHRQNIYEGDWQEKTDKGDLKVTKSIEIIEGEIVSGSADKKQS
ncbi:FxsA family protein [Thiosulfativibrio zosterae]|uniref:Membrane protein FxsA n=1 Tax=Thiosulfativibrio zosterae TaxID=2675053 RepID=A0A6F8PLK0_9GAMM|nr:FxsA family protein [Thiosulfativibrio zosterae]BBP42870.1 hypothetical protein THMIRHAT_06160 [Thiosulfativibrio zosterae]